MAEACTRSRNRREFAGSNRRRALVVHETTIGRANEIVRHVADEAQIGPKRRGSPRRDQLTVQ